MSMREGNTRLHVAGMVAMALGAMALTGCTPAVELQAHIEASRTSGLAPLTIHFDAGGSTAGTGREIITYTWDFGDGSPEQTGMSVEHTFDVDGREPATYTVQLAVVDSMGRGARDTVDITVARYLPAPVELTDHTDAVHGVAFNPEGTVLATASQDGTAKLWDASTWSLVRTLTGHLAGLNVVAFAPDGQTLATGSSDQAVRLWDVPTGETTMTLPAHTDAVHGLSFDPSGAMLASTCVAQGGPIHVHATATGDRIVVLRGATGHAFWVPSVDFHPDGRWLASGSADRTAKIWDMAEGSDVAYRAVTTMRGHTGTVWSVAFSPDGTWLATGSEDRSVRLWSTVTGHMQDSLIVHQEGVIAIAFSPDGRFLASGSKDGEVHIWDLELTKSVGKLPYFGPSLNDLAFGPCGKRLATASDDFVRVWDISLLVY